MINVSNILNRTLNKVARLSGDYKKLERISSWAQGFGVAVGDDGYFTPTTYHHFFRVREDQPIFPQLLPYFETASHEMHHLVEEINCLGSSDFVKSIPEERTNETDFYWNNGYFSGDDALAAIAFVKGYRPKLIIETGCGNSTKIFRQAIRRFSETTRLISIDPAPRAEIAGLPTELHRISLLEYGGQAFEALTENDIVFFDGSHLVHPGSDTVYFFLDVLPRLPKGVFVHIHDITLPFDYPAEFIRRRYNEQYLLALMLMGGQWEIILPVFSLSRKNILQQGGVSFWLRRS